MVPRHADRLSVVDTSFLHLEDGRAHKHIGACVTLAGAAPTVQALAEHVTSRVHLVPRFRQRLLRCGGRPLWVDDEMFQAAAHVRTLTLPAPGGERELADAVAAVFAEPLDLARPLWELVIVDGLAQDPADGARFALVNKTHHSLIDGASGVDLMAVLFDLTHTPAVVGPPPAWTASTAPSAYRLLGRHLRELAPVPFRLLFGLLAPLLRSARALTSFRALLATLGPPALRGAPRTLLNTAHGAARTIRWVTVPLVEIKKVKEGLGGTVNDVVLAVVTGAVRRWLTDRGESCESPLQALVPMSIRTADQKNAFGNQVTAMRTPLPVDLADPVERLRRVTATTEGLKRSRQLYGAAVVAQLQRYLPAPVTRLLARLIYHPRIFNLIVTNVPGPQLPLWLLGHRLVTITAIAFLPRRHALSVAVMSCDGQLSFGMLGAPEVTGPLDDLADHVRRELATLGVAAEIVATAR